MHGMACFSIQINRSKQDQPHQPTLVRIPNSSSSGWARVNRLRASAHLRCCKGEQETCGLGYGGGNGRQDTIYMVNVPDANWPQRQNSWTLCQRWHLAVAYLYSTRLQSHLANTLKLVSLPPSDINKIWRSQMTSFVETSFPSRVGCIPATGNWVKLIN